jgi:hypothetical protein
VAVQHTEAQTLSLLITDRRLRLALGISPPTAFPIVPTALIELSCNTTVLASHVYFQATAWLTEGLDSPLRQSLSAAMAPLHKRTLSGVVQIGVLAELNGPFGP